MTQKIDLIGKTKEPPKISQAEFESLIEKAVYAPLHFPKAVSLCFCRKCGSHGEITKEYVEDLKPLIKTELEINFNDAKELRMHYFVTNHCEICYREDIPLYVEIKKIDFNV
jgi:hypothetical protein